MAATKLSSKHTNYSKNTLFEDRRVRITGVDAESDSWAIVENKVCADIKLEFPRTDDFCDVSFKDEPAPYIEVPANSSVSLCAQELGINWLQAFEQGAFSIWIRGLHNLQVFLNNGLI